MNVEEKITFIIVTWNNEDTIIECLDSIYKFCKDFKIVIVDNNSSDNTIKVIKDRKYKNCELVCSKDNNGFAKGNNIALDYVDTKYICYLNPDTILIEDIIEPSIKILEEKKDVGIVGSKLLYKDYKLQASTFNFDTPLQIYFENLRIGKIFPNIIKEKFFPNLSKCKKDKYVDWIIGAEMILLTEDAKEIGGFSEEYYMYTEDMDLCKKVEKYLNKKVYYISNNKLIHIGGVSESKNVNYNKMKKLIDNKVMFVNKFYSKKYAIKTMKALKNSYAIRHFLLKIFYFGKNRKILLEKMQKGYEFSKNAVEVIN